MWKVLITILRFNMTKIITILWVHGSLCGLVRLKHTNTLQVGTINERFRLLVFHILLLSIIIFLINLNLISNIFYIIYFWSSLNVRWNRLSGQFWLELGEISFIKYEFSSVSIKNLRVEMNSVSSNSIGAPKLSNFNNCIMNFQKFWLNFCHIPLKTKWKMNPFHLIFRLHLYFLPIKWLILIILNMININYVKWYPMYYW